MHSLIILPHSPPIFCPSPPLGMQLDTHTHMRAHTVSCLGVPAGHRAKLGQCGGEKDREQERGPKQIQDIQGEVLIESSLQEVHGHLQQSGGEVHAHL